MSALNVLIVEDNPSDVRLLHQELLRAGYAPSVTHVQTEPDFLFQLALDRHPDIVLCDFNMPQFDALRALELLRMHRPDIPFLIVSGSIGEETAVHAIKMGATDYLLKDRLGRIGPAVKYALEQRNLRRAERMAQDSLRFQKALLECQSEASPDGILVVGPDLRILSYNRRFIEIWGIPAAIVEARDDEQVLAEVLTHTADPVGFAARVAAIYADPDLESHEEVALADGRTLDRLSRPVQGLDGERYGRVWYFRDITRRKQSEEAIRTSEERFRAFMDNSPVAAFIKDEESRFLFVNPTWRRQFDPEPQEWLGRNDFDFWPPATAELFRTSDAECLARNAVLQFEETALSSSGEHHTWLVMKFPLIVGEHRRVGGMAWDITDRKRAEQIRADQIRLTTLIGDVGLSLNQGETLREMLRLCTEAVVRHLDAAYVRIWTLNPEGTVLELQASAGIHTHLDGPHSRVPVGMHKIGRIAQERRPHRTNPAIGDPRVGDPDWAECEGIVAFAGYPLLVGQRLIGVIALFARQPLGEPAVQALVAVADQIAQGIDRKTTEQALHLRDRAISAATQGLMITDPSLPDNPIVYVSPGSERITGYSAAEFIGRNCRILQGRDTDPAAIDRIRTAVRDGQSCTVELLNYRKDGTPFWNEMSISPIRDAAGRLTHYVGVQADVTARRTLEEQFRQAQKMEAVGQLASGVAHDFNNLLTIINGYSELLLETLPDGDATRGMIAEIHKAGERSAALTRQLLAFGRQQMLSPKRLDLNDVIHETESMLRRVIGENIQLKTVLASPLAAVTADRGQLEQVLMNLVVNARDAMPDGGRLTIETANVQSDESQPDLRPGRYVLLTVNDTGTGMTEDVRRHLFEPFFTTKELGKGTGLGLAVVHGVVKQSEGSIAVHSELGVGTSFRIYLPQTGAAAATDPARTTVGPAPRGTEVILVVEDETAVRALTVQTLRGSGYRVLEANNGEDALHLASTSAESIQLILTDVVMPGMGGRRLVDQMLEHHPRVKVLYMSGYTDDAVLRHGILQDQVNFLQKPFTPNALSHKVRAALGL